MEPAGFWSGFNRLLEAKVELYLRDTGEAGVFYLKA
jgi:hypothetical protein